MDDNGKVFIYVGNLREKKTFFNLSMQNFLITVILAVVFGMLSLKDFRFQFFIVPIAYFILNVEMLVGKTSLFHWMKVALNYLVFTQQEFRWGRKED